MSEKALWAEPLWKNSEMQLQPDKGFKARHENQLSLKKLLVQDHVSAPSSLHQEGFCVHIWI
jgi:hypothetical protein